MMERISLIKLCAIEPNALRRSRNEMASGKPCWIALSNIEQMEKMCSIVPLIPDIWREGWTMAYLVENVQDVLLGFCGIV